jgi:hypothetical protein
VPAKKKDSRRPSWPALSAADRDALESFDDLDLAVSHALQCGDLAPVVRYLREIVAPLIERRIRGQICSTAAVELLADMLEGRESIPWHLKRVWSRRGKPTDVARTDFRNIAIGRWIAATQRMLREFIGPLRPSDPRPVLKAVVADACVKFNIKSVHAYKCLELYKEYSFHNERYEPMPLAKRPPRKVKKARLKP